MKHSKTVRIIHCLCDEETGDEILVVTEGDKVVSVKEGSKEYPLWNIPPSISSVISFYLPGVVIDYKPLWLEDGAKTFTRCVVGGYQLEFLLPGRVTIDPEQEKITVTGADGIVLFDRVTPVTVLSGHKFFVNGISFTLTLEEEPMWEPGPGNYENAVSVLAPILVKSIEFEAQASSIKLVSNLLILALRGLNETL